MKTSYTLCTGISEGKRCELTATYDRYCPEMEKKSTVHYDPIPYNMETKKCNKYINEQNLIDEGLK
jgi:hypothetical protein